MSDLTKLLQQRLDAERARTAQLAAENRRLYEAARLALETLSEALPYHEDDCCAFCGGSSGDHAGDCAKVAAIAALKAALGVE